MKRILISKYQNFIASALFDEKKLVEVSLTPMACDGPKLDEIYVGRVSRINENINAAFMDLGFGEECYYSLEENKSPIFTKKQGKKELNVGDELLLQIEKEAQKNKLFTVTSNLSCKGRFAILTSGRNTLGISKKIDPERKKELSEALSSVKPEGMGMIVRTNAAEEENAMEDLLSEISASVEAFSTEIEQWKHRTLYSCVRRSEPDYIAFIRDCYASQYDEIVVDDEAVAEVIRDTLDEKIRSKIRIYKDSYPLGKLYNLEKQIEEATKEKVWLKSGAYLVIQPTEALTVIDVNSGKNVTKGSKSENNRRINIEAAYEIARQIRLRNISGIILVDFIDVKDIQEEMISTMKQLLLSDPIPTSVMDMTALNLMEITRKKVKKPLAEQMIQ